MKAKLNRNFTNFLKTIDYLWLIRKDIKENKLVLEYPNYLDCKDAGKFSGDLVDVLQESVFDLHNCSFSTKKQFLNRVLSKTCFSFYDEFVVSFEHDGKIS